MNVLQIIGLAIFGAIGLFTGGCALLFFIGSEGTGGGFLEVQLMGFGIAAVCGLVVYAILKSRSRSGPDDADQ
ncbi:hypothetical protein [Roseovarius sp. 2305UL8-3]|uniref:hypothetical protein n=1 Tax=Roseovarius conchicola TaxID=3121636 RepID=UPI003529075F